MDSISVEENIMLPMILGKKKSDEMKKVVRQYAERFEISHLLEKILMNSQAEKSSGPPSAEPL